MLRTLQVLDWGSWRRGGLGPRVITGVAPRTSKAPFAFSPGQGCTLVTVDDIQQIGSGECQVQFIQIPLDLIIEIFRIVAHSDSMHLRVASVCRGCGLRIGNIQGKYTACAQVSHHSRLLSPASSIQKFTMRITPDILVWRCCLLLFFASCTRHVYPVWLTKQLCHK